MKNFLCLSLMLLSFDLFALTKNYKIQDSMCGEIDPFLIGDACIFTIQATDEKHPHYLIINLDDIMLSYSEVDDFTGKSMVLDLEMMDKADPEIRRYLKRWFEITRTTKTLVLPYGGDFEILD